MHRVKEEMEGKMKKNFLRIPENLSAKAIRSKDDNIVAFGLLKAKYDDINDGKYSHLNLSIESGKVNFSKNFTPSKNQGKYSNWNIHGREFKRKDLPKERYYNYVESPNWGNSYSGTHTVALPGERYPVEFVPPRFSSFTVELITEINGDYIFRFVLSEVLNRKSKYFHDRFLFSINLLQENIGSVDIVESSVSSIEYMKTQTISWEILPPGEKDKFVKKLFAGREIAAEEKKTIEDRYDFFIRLKPKEMIIGVNSFQRYFGAKLDDDLVIFENTGYGNAQYIMFRNWVELSKKSRIELLSGRYGKDFERVIHTGDWKEKTKLILKNHRKKKLT